MNSLRRMKARRRKLINIEDNENKMSTKEIMDRCNKVMFAQMSTYKGLKIYKEKAVAALVK